MRYALLHALWQRWFFHRLCDEFVVEFDVGEHIYASIAIGYNGIANLRMVTLMNPRKTARRKFHKQPKENLLKALWIASVLAVVAPPPHAFAQSNLGELLDQGAKKISKKNNCVSA